MATEVRVLADIPKIGNVGVKGLVGMLRRPTSPKLPDRSALVQTHSQDVARLAEYCRVTGFTLRDAVPVTWLHVLTFPMQVNLMAERDFPFGLAGLVHVRNEMTLHRPVLVTDKLRLSVWAQNAQPHKRGVTYEMRGKIHVGDELAWEGVSTYLTTAAKLPGKPQEVERLEAPDVAGSQTWRLAPDLGRKYAAVSGDRNPIHTHAWTARMFGFKRPIIHGMWTHAKALASLGALPDSYTVKVGFTRPILLPGKVSFATDGKRFAVVNQGGKPHLVGRV